MSEEDDVSVNYSQDEDYDISPVSGIRGSEQPSGGFKFDFLLDYNQTPTRDIYTSEEGGEVEAVKREGGQDIERVLQHGIFVSEDTAKEIGVFVLSHATQSHPNDIAKVLSENLEGVEVEQEYEEHNNE